jgi:hypothetical protein
MRTPTRLLQVYARFAGRVAVVIAALCVLLAMVGASSAFAAAPILSVSTVTVTDAHEAHLVPGAEGALGVTVNNLGSALADGGAIPIVIQDTLPAGLEATGVSNEAECAVIDAQEVRCESRDELLPFNGSIYTEIKVQVSPTASGSLLNEVRVAGGGAASVLAREAVTVGATQPGFGIEKFQNVITNEDGSLDTQAGSHPYQLTATTVLNEPGTTKDLRFQLPPGLVGNTNVVAQCTSPEFDAKLKGFVNECPADTAIGVAAVWVLVPGGEPFSISVPVFNLVPSPGEPARFGFTVARIPVTLDTSVRTGQGYGVVVSANNITQLKGLIESRVSFWGVPGDSAHNSVRGWGCLDPEEAEEGGLPECNHAEALRETPFLTLPTSCAGGAEAMRSTVEADSWLDEGKFEKENGESVPPEGLTGCNALRFEPSIGVAPDGPEASTPTGLKVGVNLPQNGALSATGLAPSAAKSVTVTLPPGMTVNPAAGDTVGACSTAQIGFEGLRELDPSAEPGVQTAQFTPEGPSCPDASKLATVKLKTPLLPNPLEGEIYLAAPQNFQGLPENPFSSLIALYLVAEDPVSGVLVKLAGRVTPSASGQLTATFENPELPYEEAEIHFFGSDRAPLNTPALCGTYTTTTSIVPWSGTETVSPSSSFNITTGPDGSGQAGCSSPRQWTPGFQAGSTNLQAGAFTPFTLTMSRPDQDQTLSKIEMSMPQGLSGVLSNVKLCGETEANAGTCGPESLIGETIVSAGLGGDPYTVTGGKVYITSAYGGGNYGLSIVNPAKAGPFVLQEGRPVIVRAAIFVDPHTAALRIVSNPLPTIIDGIPLQIQHVNVTINRPGFTFNPTNCAKTAITATLGSSEGGSAGEETPFQVTNCATLKFAPKFTVSTAGATSRLKGASLKVKLTYPTGASYANIKSVKVDLPKQLPSRLTTLQKACLAKVFEANPANCPKESIVGQAKAITPILPVPLQGPAYFVSYGNEKFPALIVVLQGYGVTVDLVGTTFISHAGITSSTFKTVPDVPVGTFELTLPTGKYSALAANLPTKARSSFCGQTLAMPTAFTAQNGLEIHESTKIGVTGCPKAKKSSKKKKAAVKKKAKK